MTKKDPLVHCFEVMSSVCPVMASRFINLMNAKHIRTEDQLIDDICGRLNNHPVPCDLGMRLMNRNIPWTRRFNITAAKTIRDLMLF